MMSGVKRFEIWMANLNPQRGTEVGKVRPVLIVQTNLLNELIPSTIICPITTKPTKSEITKVNIKSDDFSGLQFESWVILDQMRSIDNRRLVRKIGELPFEIHSKMNENLKIILGVE